MLAHRHVSISLLTVFALIASLIAGCAGIDKATTGAAAGAGIGALAGQLIGHNTAGTLIGTPRGPVPVETLRPGDLVVTRDHGAVPVLWSGGRSLTAGDLAAEPGLLPVAIRENALGRHGALLLSPQHAVLALTDQGERLVRARHLAALNDPRFRIARGKRRVSYHHILLQRHGIVTANGLPCETLYPGPMALAALGPAARLSIALAQPWLAGVVLGAADPLAVYGPTARPLAARRGLRLLEAGALPRQRVA